MLLQQGRLHFKAPFAQAEVAAKETRLLNYPLAIPHWRHTFYKGLCCPLLQFGNTGEVSVMAPAEDCCMRWS